MTELHEYCRMCGGKCCTNPWMSKDEYLRLALALGNERLMAARPIQIMGGWMFREGRCPGALEDGCILTYRDRPLICRTYPFIPATVVNKQMKEETILLLRVDTCPYWRVFGERFEYVKQEMIDDGKKTRV